MKKQECEQLTLFQEASPVNRSVLPGSEEARKMTVTSGLKCLESYQNSGPLGLLVRMLLGSSIWRSTRCTLTWKTKDTPSRCLLFRLVPSTPRTEDTASQLWATPNTMDYLPQRSPEALRRQAETSRKGRKRPANLREQVCEDTVRLWPTPRANCMNGASRAPRRQGAPDLQTVVAMFPTPTTERLCGGSGAAERLEEMEASGQITPEERRSIQAGNGGQLNPDWVEWLMGYPIGWSEV